MLAYPLRVTALAFAAVVGLSACTSPYGYSGVSMGVGNAGYYDPYYGGYGYGAGYGYGGGYGYPGYSLAYAPYWGWYDDFYYPGTGYYVYDRHHHKHHWTDAQRRYWQARRDRAVATGTTSQPVVIRDNWRDFTRDRSRMRSNRVARQQSATGSSTVDTEGQQLGQPVHVDRQHERVVRTENTTTSARVDHDTSRAQRSVARQERQTARESRRSEMRADRSSRGNGRANSSASED